MTDGTVETDLRTEFVEAGINQTLHRIYLEVRCNVTILTPYDTIKETIVNQVLLVEGVIIGNIPDTYYNLEGLDGSQSMEMIDWWDKGTVLLSHFRDKVTLLLLELLNKRDTPKSSRTWTKGTLQKVQILEYWCHFFYYSKIEVERIE